MTATAPTFSYIATDIPEGTTIDEWRRARPDTRSSVRRSLKRLSRRIRMTSPAAMA